MTTKAIEWATRPLTVQEAIWVQYAKDGDIEAAVALAVARSDGQLREEDVLAMVADDFNEMLVALAAAVVAAAQPAVRDLWRRG
jgi:hypothetical protein